MKKPITGFHQDEHADWVAELACGHNQHVRHNPPWSSRPWTQSETGRSGMLGHELDCKKCDRDEPRDNPPCKLSSNRFELVRGTGNTTVERQTRNNKKSL